jgi:hypothetical protein
MLSNQQIEQLFAFTEKKLVRHYDVQCELVDHLATKIEEEMKADTTLSFDLALEKVYAGFGIFGFAIIVKEKSAQVHLTNKLLWKAELKKLFAWPNILGTLALALTLYTLMQILPKSYFIIIGGLLATAVTIMEMYCRYKIQHKKLMLTQSTEYTLLSGLWYLPTMFVTGFDQEQWMQGNTYLFFAIIFFIMLTSIASIQVAMRIDEKAKELYKEVYA